MKKILLPTDFSDNSWNAIDYAVELFKDEECVFFLVNIYNQILYESIHYSDISSERSVENTVKVDRLMNLEHIRQVAIDIYPNSKHTFKTIATLGPLVDAIGNIVKREKIDLIVMGTKGATGAKEVFLGSSTVQIINSIKSCPVLAVPYSFSFISKPSEITFATDFTHFYSKEELQPLIDLAISFKATIRIVHITKGQGSLSEEQKFNLGMLHKYFKQIEYYQHTLTKGDSIASTLQRFSEELNTYLLVMLHYKHSFIEKLTKEPTIKNIAFHTETPFLILPELGMSAAFSLTDKEVAKL